MTDFSRRIETDAKLIAATMAGDEHAFRELVQVYQGPVFGLAQHVEYGLGLDPHRAGDADAAALHATLPNGQDWLMRKGRSDLADLCALVEFLHDEAALRPAKRKQAARDAGARQEATPESHVQRADGSEAEGSGNGLRIFGR